ncbi:MAG: acyltransferase domain-containing protein [Candidatus Latescibacteria bacterium]|jgi:hypothetical protein|nr:acyltransferase domain-containing protein [Candidatus Latescibacterota bacterium]
MTKMDLNTVVSHIGEPETVEAIRPHWEESVTSLPKDLPGFLRPNQITVAREWGGFGPEVDSVLIETASRIAAEPILRHLAWHAHQLMFVHTDFSDFGRWPRLEGALGARAGVFYLLLSLAVVPRIRKAHRSRGVPEEVTRANCRDLSIGAKRYSAISGGRLGSGRRLLGWHRLVASGDLYRLGRMQYVHRPFRGRLRVYRNRGTGNTVALSDGGIQYDGEGYIAGPDDSSGEESPRTSTLEETETTVTGTPISPKGMAVRSQVTLSLDEWSPALATGDPVLEMHIPEGEPLSLEACGSSMRRAVDFFPVYEPDKPFAGIASTSWIFNTQLEEMLSTSSNLVGYQHELHLFPVPTNGRAGLYFIFYQDDVDPETAPRDTSLKRAVLDHLAAGKPLRSGGMFMLTEDLPHFGTQYYRKKWPPQDIGTDP